MNITQWAMSNLLADEAEKIFGQGLIDVMWIDDALDDGVVVDGQVDGLAEGVLVKAEVKQDPSGTIMSSLMGETVSSGNSSSLINSTRLALSSARELEKNGVRIQPLSALPPRQSRMASSRTVSSQPEIKSA